MSLVFCIISILQEFPYFASAISLDFAGFFRFFPLLFTHACPATEFCRCFAFQIGKICCHNCIVRNFQFRKFLPVYSNIFPRFSQLRNCFSTKSSVPGCVLRISRFSISTPQKPPATPADKTLPASPAHPPATRGFHRNALPLSRSNAPNPRSAPPAMHTPAPSPGFCSEPQPKYLSQYLQLTKHLPGSPRLPAAFPVFSPAATLP